MYENETKNELKIIFIAKQTISKEFRSIKQAIVNLDKLGHDTSILEKTMIDLEVELDRFKTISKDFINDKLGRL